MPRFFDFFLNTTNPDANSLSALTKRFCRSQKKKKKKKKAGKFSATSSLIEGSIHLFRGPCQQDVQNVSQLIQTNKTIVMCPECGTVGMNGFCAPERSLAPGTGWVWLVTEPLHRYCTFQTPTLSVGQITRVSVWLHSTRVLDTENIAFCQTPMTTSSCIQTHVTHDPPPPSTSLILFLSLSLSLSLFSYLFSLSLSLSLSLTSHTHTSITHTHTHMRARTPCVYVCVCVCVCVVCVREREREREREMRERERERKRERERESRER